jgi:hypothetical protein
LEGLLLPMYTLFYAVQSEHVGKVGALLGGFDTRVFFHSEHKI